MLLGVKRTKFDGTVKTNVDYYNKYVANGTWTPIGDVKYYGNHAGIITVEEVTKKKPNEVVRTVVIIHGYYPWSFR